MLQRLGRDGAIGVILKDAVRVFGDVLDAGPVVELDRPDGACWIDDAAARRVDMMSRMRLPAIGRPGLATSAHGFRTCSEHRERARRALEANAVSERMLRAGHRSAHEGHGGVRPGV